MNRNAHGDEFSIAELRSLVVDHDLLPAHKLEATLASEHSANGQRSLLLDLTRTLRWRLWAAGTNGFSLRTEAWVSTQPPPRVDAETLAWIAESAAVPA